MPTIRLVRAPTQAKIDFVPSAAKRTHEHRQIEGVNERIAFVDRRAGRQPRVLEPRAIDEGQAILVIGRPEHDRQGIGEIPKPVVGGVFDIGAIADGKPFAQASIAFARRHERGRKESILVLGRTQTKADLERLLTAHSGSELGEDTWKIVRVDRKLPAVSAGMRRVQAGERAPGRVCINACPIRLGHEHGAAQALREHAQRGGFELAHRTGGHSCSCSLPTSPADSNVRALIPACGHRRDGPLP